MRCPKLLFFSVTYAIAEIQEALERQSNQRQLSDTEVRELSALLTRCVYMGEVLVTYAQALGGTPSRN